VPGEHQQPCRDEVLASPGGAGEPGTGDPAGALDANIVTALSHLAEVITQRLQFGPFRGQQRFAMQGRGESLVCRRHASVFPTPGKQLDGHPLLSPPSL
jgi:hypothetical protein